LIDIGGSAGDDGEERLYLQKHCITNEKTALSRVVDPAPTEVGIGPCFRRFDRHPEDNRVEVYPTFQRPQSAPSAQHRGD
jgi:hypothetical protein